MTTTTPLAAASIQYARRLEEKIPRQRALVLYWLVLGVIAALLLLGGFALYRWKLDLLYLAIGGVVVLIGYILAASAAFDVVFDFYDRHELFLKDAQLGACAQMEKYLGTGLIDVNFKDEQGDTALMKAAARGHADAVQLLLTHGAALNEKNRQGRTALMLAEEKGRDLVEILTKAGAVE